MKDIQIESTTLRHITQLYDCMRPEDRREVVAATGKFPYDVLLETHKVSRDTFAFMDRGFVIACVGIQPYSVASGTASPWMLSTVRMPDYPRELLHYSRKLTDHWASEYDLLVNFVDARYTKALRWVQKLGFTVFPAQPHGPNGAMFHKIERRG